jgi:membrane protease YdiL (CAAX protease family)
MLVLETSEPAPKSVPAANPMTRKPRVWTAFATFLGAAIVGNLAVIAAFVAMGVGTGIMMGAQGADGAKIQARIQELCRQPLPALLLSLIPCQLGMTAVVLFAAWRSKEPIKQRLGLVPPTGRAFGGFKLATMAAFTVSTALASFILSNLFVGPPPTGNPIAAVITNGSWWAITLLSILLSVIPALVEESLFRGYLQRRFLQRWSPAVAISVSSLLFALMHMDSLQHIIAVVPLGVVTGVLAYRTNSVKPGMLVHAVHNTAAVGFGALATALTPHVSQEELGLLLIGMIGLLGLIGLPAVISLLRSAKPRPSVEAHAAPELVVETPSARSRELSLPKYGIDSRLVTPAV